MGRAAASTPASAVASALFTPVQRRVLGLLFGQPDRTFQSAELIRLAGSGTGAVHRQLQRLEKAGLVAVSRDGNQKYYAARKDAPVFPELHGLIVKTVGVVEPLRSALTPIARDIDLAFVFGSVAKGSERAGSDIDLMVVTDKLAYADVYAALESAERTLNRTINPTVFTRAEWKKKRARRLVCRTDLRATSALRDRERRWRRMKRSKGWRAPGSSSPNRRDARRSPA